MNEKPEALAGRLDDERMNLIERLADENERLHDELRQSSIDITRAEVERLKAENERLRDGLACDWAELKACRASLREHLLKIERLREALALAERLAANRLAMVEQLTGEVEALRRDAFRKGFYAGFAATGEGWNGEYPFQDKNKPIVGDPSVEAAIDAAMGDKT